jgi:hypothetical protein
MEYYIYFRYWYLLPLGYVIIIKAKVSTLRHETITDLGLCVFDQTILEGDITTTGSIPLLVDY